MAMRPFGSWPPVASYACEDSVVASANCLVPLPLKVRLTCHEPVGTPLEFVGRPAEALDTSVPCTTVGPRMYFAWFVRSHVTRKPSAGSIAPGCSFEQSRLSNAFCTSAGIGVLYARST